jgi:hypothetical protein
MENFADHRSWRKSGARVGFHSATPSALCFRLNHFAEYQFRLLQPHSSLLARKFASLASLYVHFSPGPGRCEQAVVKHM